MARQSSVIAPRRRARFIVRPLFAALAAAGVVAPASGATINVTTGGDAGTGVTCTLRQAAESLNLAALQGACGIASGAFGTLDTVNLGLQAGTIALASGAIQATVPMTFDGPGAAALTISGANASQVFVGPELVIQGLTVANGRSVGFGGCISADDLQLRNSVVTGCTATADPVALYPNGLGGGVAAKYLYSYRSSIIGNTAATAGGGAFALGGVFAQTLVSGNTVATTNCPAVESEACVTAGLGGGGILGETVLTRESTISGNTVNASRFTKYNDETQQTYFVRVGLGGGISQLPLSTIAESNVGTARAKAGVRSSFSRGLTTGAGNGPARAVVKAELRKHTGAVAKVDGEGKYIVGLSHSTVSGNLVTGPGTSVAEAKYGGGGVVGLSFEYNAEVANSTISGNRLDDGNGADTFGGAMITGVVDMSNSTITGNVGNTAVAMNGPSMLALAAKAGTGPAMKKALARVERLMAGGGSLAKRATTKAITPPVFDSTILSNVVLDGYEVTCGPGCTISGANNLIRSVGFGVIVPPDTLTSDPQLAPLAYNGGTLAGAPGHPLTRSMPTHLLFLGSPAIDAGNNVEGFEFDQRGPGFPRVVGPAADIGAIEGFALRPQVPVPALAPWLVAMLSALLGVLGLTRRRRSG